MIIYRRINGKETAMAVGAQKARLGRGLASLIGGPLEDIAGTEQRNVPLASLKPGRFNPRRNFAETQLEELAASIRERGLVQPLVVRPSSIETESFEIVAGERRWRAAQLAGLHELPVVVRALSDQEAVEIAIIENVQREDLNAIEEGEGYKLLMDGHGYTQEDLARVIGKSRSHLANTLRLLKLPEDVQELVRTGAISAGHARALIGRADASRLAARIVNEGLTVRQIEALVKDAVTKPKREKPRKDADTKAAELELSEALGLGVEIRRKGKSEKGELRIRYTSLDQLEDLRYRLLRKPGR
jgi:ParB family transcriptional regulator, chromosome partitioning protein